MNPPCIDTFRLPYLTIGTLRYLFIALGTSWHEALHCGMTIVAGSKEENRA